MYVVREGYEGLVRGNVETLKRKVSFNQDVLPQKTEDDVEDKMINNLRFGDGNLLKEGEGDAMDGIDHPGARSLKGRYIIRVGWDDVRGWFAMVRSNGSQYTYKNYSLHSLELICREVQSLVQPVQPPSAQEKVDSQRLTISSQKASTHSLYVVATALSQVQTSSAPNGPL